MNEKRNWEYYGIDDRPDLLIRKSGGLIDKLTTEGWKMYGNIAALYERGEGISLDEAAAIAERVYPAAVNEIRG